MNGYIYKITNKKNNNCYIGSSINPSKRWKEHLRIHENKKQQIHRAIDKHGVDNFTFEIIDVIDITENNKELFILEESYIKKYNSFKKGYNAVEKPFQNGNALYLKKEVLEELIKTKSKSEIAEELKCSVASVIKYLKHHNLNSTIKTKNKNNKLDKIIEMKEKGYKLIEIANELNCSKSNIEGYIRRYGIGNKYGRPKYSFKLTKEELRKELDEKSIYQLSRESGHSTNMIRYWINKWDLNGKKLKWEDSETYLNSKEIKSGTYGIYNNSKLIFIGKAKNIVYTYKNLNSFNWLKNGKGRNIDLSDYILKIRKENLEFKVIDTLIE